MIDSHRERALKCAGIDSDTTLRIVPFFDAWVQSGPTSIARVQPSLIRTRASTESVAVVELSFIISLTAAFVTASIPALVLLLLTTATSLV